MTYQIGTLRIEVQTRRIVRRRRNRRVAIARDLALEPALLFALACGAATLLTALARLGGAL